MAQGAGAAPADDVGGGRGRGARPGRRGLHPVGQCRETTDVGEEDRDRSVLAAELHAAFQEFLSTHLAGG